MWIVQSPKVLTVLKWVQVVAFQANPALRPIHPDPDEESGMPSVGEWKAGGQKTAIDLPLNQMRPTRSQLVGPRVIGG